MIMMCMPVLQWLAWLVSWWFAPYHASQMFFIFVFPEKVPALEAYSLLVASP